MPLVTGVRAVAGPVNTGAAAGVVWPQLVVDVSYTGRISLTVATKVRAGAELGRPWVSWHFSIACASTRAQLARRLSCARHRSWAPYNLQHTSAPGVRVQTQVWEGGGGKGGCLSVAVGTTLRQTRHACAGTYAPVPVQCHAVPQLLLSLPNSSPGTGHPTPSIATVAAAVGHAQLAASSQQLQPADGPSSTPAEAGDHTSSATHQAGPGAGSAGAASGAGGSGFINLSQITRMAVATAQHWTHNFAGTMAAGGKGGQRLQQHATCCAQACASWCAQHWSWLARCTHMQRAWHGCLLNWPLTSPALRAR